MNPRTTRGPEGKASRQIGSTALRLLIAGTLVIAMLSVLSRRQDLPRNYNDNFGASSVAPQSADTRTAPTPAQGGPSLGLQEGTRLVYALRQSCTVRIAGSNSLGPAPGGGDPFTAALRLEQSGDLALNIYREAEDGWLVGFAFEDPTVQLTAEGRSASMTQSEIELKSEILCLVRPSGRIARMVDPGHASDETLGIWRDVLSRWQTVLARARGVREWNETEEDSLGTFLATYSRTNNQDPDSLIKEKRRYIQIGTSDNQGLDSRVSVNGRAIIALRPFPAEIEGVEDVTIETPELGGTITSHAEYSLSLKVLDAAPDLLSAAEAASHRLQSGTLLTWQSQPEAVRPLSHVDIAGTTIEGELAVLDQLCAAGINGTPAEVRTLERIVAHIQQDDHAVEAIVDRLRLPDAATNRPISSALVGMLGAAATPKAQQTLIGLVNTEGWPEDHRQMAIFSFAQVTQPIPEVDAWLGDIHAKQQDFSDNALLVLAAMGNRVREQDPERFQQIASYVIEAASQSGDDPNRQIVGFEAIGNLGPLTVPHAVRDALQSEDSTVRERALASLKRISDFEADSILRDRLHNDPAASVRAGAASLLGDGQRQGASDDLQQAALYDPSEAVRLAAIRSLSEAVKQDPTLGATLELIARADPSADVKDAAARVLGTKTELAHGALSSP